MKHLNRPACLFICFALYTGLSCGIVKEVDLSDDGKIDVIFVTPDHTPGKHDADTGSHVHLAAAAALKERYLKKNPNTLLLARGDLSPAAGCNELPHKEDGGCGKHMVNAMDNAGVDIAALEIGAAGMLDERLRQHIHESGLEWIAPAAFHSSGCMPVPTYNIRTFCDADGTTARVGFLHIGHPSGAEEDSASVLQSAAAVYDHIKDSCDAIVAITGRHAQHNSGVKDRLPGIDAIIGNHSAGLKAAAHVTRLHIHKKAGTSAAVKKRVKQYPVLL